MYPDWVHIVPNLGTFCPDCLRFSRPGTILPQLLQIPLYLPQLLHRQAPQLRRQAVDLRLDGLDLSGVPGGSGRVGLLHENRRMGVSCTASTVPGPFGKAYAQIGPNLLHSQLQRLAVTIPAKDLAVAQDIATSTNAVMGLPFAPSLAASVLPHELLVTAPRMAMRDSLALTSPASSLPCLSHNTFRECHLIPPPMP